MDQYEYMTAALNGKDMDDSDGLFAVKLNKHGKNGWELVSVISQPCLGSSQYNLLGISQKNTLIFKRQLEHNEEVQK